jgi:sulfoxide reductase heme-binding subunit YedZ
MADRNRRRQGGEALGMSATLPRKSAPSPRTGGAVPWPWLDKGRRFSWLRFGVLVFFLAPGLSLLAMLATGGLGAEPWKAATRQSGELALRLLIVTLAVTPLRWIAEWPKAATLRRMLGLIALGYAALHLVLYTGHLAWDLLAVVTEIATRVYLTLGFAVLVGLCVLGWTSTDAAQARLGRRWKKLHQIAYPLTAAAVLHAFLQSKASADAAVLMAGLFVWMMAWRRLEGQWRGDGRALLALAPIAALGTAALEYAWYALATKLPAERILMANLEPDLLRPAHVVFLAAVGVAALPFLVRVGRRLAARLTRRQVRTPV